MFVKHLDHLNLSVQDFDRTVDWYGRVFGFSLVEEGTSDDWASDGPVRFGVLRAGEAMLCIYENPKLRYAHAQEIREQFGIHSIAHFGIRITDVEAWKATIEREQIPIIYGGPIDWLHSTAWYVADPTGYGIEVAAWDNDAVSFDSVAAARH